MVRCSWARATTASSTRGVRRGPEIRCVFWRALVAMRCLMVARVNAGHNPVLVGAFKDVRDTGALDMRASEARASRGNPMMWWYAGTRRRLPHVRGAGVAPSPPRDCNRARYGTGCERRTERPCFPGRPDRPKCRHPPNGVERGLRDPSRPVAQRMDMRRVDAWCASRSATPPMP